MEMLTVGGRRYSDPDVIALATENGKAADPRLSIKTKARNLLERLNRYPGVPTDRFERMKVLASLNGIRIQPMDLGLLQKNGREAVLYNTSTGWQVLYNPAQPRTRLLFTLAHEII